MKSIHTLVPDIYQVVETRGGWDQVVTDYYLSRSEATIKSRLQDELEEREPTLRMSNVGKPCGRELWYSLNGSASEQLPAHVLLKFLYGDILEDLLLSLCRAAGHTVEGEQDRMEINGLVGHRDCVIDGVLVDVKSASTWSFKNKFKGQLQDEGADGFGYIRQLSSYLAASKDDPLVKDKTNAGFLVIDKTTGEICLDMYDLSKEVASAEDFVDERIAMVNSKSVPSRPWEDVPHGKSGNRKTPDGCRFCDYKKKCWPGVRTFVDWSGKPTFMTKVVRQPKMNEVK